MITKFKIFERIDFRELDPTKIYTYSKKAVLADEVDYEAIGKIKVNNFDKIIMYQFINNQNRADNFNLGMVVDLDLVREATPDEIEKWELKQAVKKYNL